MTPRTSEDPLADATSRTVLRLIRSGGASSRSRLAQRASLSPSTVADRVAKLVDAGYVREAGEGESRGGRRPRTLELDPDRGTVCAIDLGARHATVGLFDFSGRLLDHTTRPLDIAEGPDAIIPRVVSLARELHASHPAAPPLIGAALAVPGPVDSATHSLVSPSRMPGWNGLDAQAALGRAAGVPAIVGNDANLSALGELHARTTSCDPMVYVKVGSSIGCGIIIGGELYRGHGGVAGDISHVTVPGADHVLCSCGRKGCLDAVAGGRALTHDLRAEGVDAADSAAVVALARDAHPLATRMLRQAGARVGSVLAPIMNFFNPRSLVLGGVLGESEAFMAGVQSALYTECLPMVTGDLAIETSVAKRGAGIHGGAAAILDHLVA